MVRTAHPRRKAKREQPLGIALVLGLAATRAVALLIAGIQFLDPHSALHNFYTLVHYNTSATLPLDPLYQEWAGKIAEEDALFGTPFSLFCGGGVFGWFAPSYMARLRTLLSSAALGFGVLAVILGFLLYEAPKQQAALNAHEGGQQVIVTMPPELILRQALLVVAWTAVCVFGTWLGLRLRERTRA